MRTDEQDWIGVFVDNGAPEASRPPAVLLAGVGDDAAVLAKLLARQKFAVTHVSDGWAALNCIRERPPDVVILHEDLPGLGGTEVCRLAKPDQCRRLLPIVLLLPDCGSSEERLEAIEVGVDHMVSAPIDVNEVIARVRALARQKRYTDDFEPAASVMTTLATMIEAHDRYSEGHCHRMANHAAALGRRIGLSADELHVLHRGAFLHDIGMLAIPDAVLLKPAGLDAEERALIQSHTIVGELLISNLRSLQAVRGIVRHHHERRDGSGYPDGLQGDDIPLSAQIVGLVDVFEAMTSPRPYRRSVSPKEALAVLHRQTQKGWHRQDLLDAFVHTVDVA
jgi:putative two-component system response regulator